MHTTRLFATTLTLTALAPLLLAQEPAEIPPLQTQVVAENVYMIAGQGGNIGLLVGQDATVLIDDQMAPMHQAIADEIDSLVPDGASSKIFLLNTHFHADHTGGNELFGETGSIIVAHDNVRQRLTVEQVVPFFDMRSPALQPVGLPVVTFSSDIGLHLNGEDIDVAYVGSSHTDGDVIVHLKNANVIHGGDLVFFGTYPFIDLDNGGNVNGFVEANQRLLAMCDDDTKIIPGHGPLIGKKEMEAYVEMLTTTRDAVAAMVAEGKSREQIVAAKPTAAFDDTWSTFINTEAYLGLLYRGLAKE